MKYTYLFLSILLFGCCCNDVENNSQNKETKPTQRTTVTPIAEITINGQKCKVMSVYSYHNEGQFNSWATENIRYIDCGEGPICGQFITGGKYPHLQ